MRYSIPNKFRREDEADDAIFYAQPRFVTHIDDRAIAAVTQLYREYLPKDGVILDLMSSWISHLPAEIKYKSVTGLGMNEQELAANPRLDRRVVQNLNREPKLPFADAEFDAGAICVSVDYLTQPVVVLRELGRVIKPGGPLILTFSNRCFPTKAISPWLELDDAGRVALVSVMMRHAENWDRILTLDRSPGRSDPLYAVVGRSKGPSGKT